MYTVDRIIERKKAAIKVEASDLSKLPARYSMALIMADRIGEACKGRVLGYDRGHCQHHALPPGTLCHCHCGNEAPTVPLCCEFLPVLDKFCMESLQYLLEAGFSYTLAISKFDADEINEALQEGLTK